MSGSALARGRCLRGFASPRRYATRPLRPLTQENARLSQMNTALGIVVAVVGILGGAAAFTFPHTLSQFQEDADTPPDQAVRQLRVGGAVLFLFCCALLYAILTAKGPPEFIGV
jgi:uncharacterized protein YjeT (DUF2065 family)